MLVRIPPDCYVQGGWWHPSHVDSPGVPATAVSKFTR